MEKENNPAPPLDLAFEEPQYAWKIYKLLRNILIRNDFKEIERDLHALFLSIEFKDWKGSESFLQAYDLIFSKKKLKFSEKGLKYIIDNIQKAWRTSIREQRETLEKTKGHFNKLKFLVLMNPLNMKPYHRNKLRKYLKEFPGLRPYRTIMTTFYRQFRLPPTKRKSLQFLMKLQGENCHPWLNSAINTLVEHEEQVYRFQTVYISTPQLKNKKSIKVVNESSNKIVNQLYRTQCGMRTLENIRMRIAHRLNCPIFISPNLIEKAN